MRTVPRTVAAALVSIAGLLNACGDVPTSNGSLTVVVSTNILGDVVRNLVGDAVEVEVVMPAGVDPHDFAPSARQATAMREADVMVVNGLGFEEGLQDTIDAAAEDGVPVVVASNAIEPVPFVDASGGGNPPTDDPHFFTDPARVRQVAEYIADELAAEIDELDAVTFRARVERYLGELDALDAEVEATLAPVPADARVLVTNHEVFGYFADRYGFEVLGAIIPGGSTLAESNAAELADLAHLIEQRDVPAIFADTSSPTRLAEALAEEGASVEVVELYSESLGEEGSGAETYIGMVRTNAQRIADALT